jgi:molecular chaperone HscB
MPADTQLGSQQGSACWSCAAQVQSHFCNSCGKVQPPAPADYFSFFGVPRKLNIDLVALEREFYKLSRRLHPDVYARATDQEQGWSIEQSSMLNDAYRTLRDPVERTEYLLGLEGVKLEEQSKQATDAARASGGEKKQVVPPDLLEEVFELNMQLEEMRMAKKTGETDIDAIESLRTAKRNFETRLEASQSELKKFWDEWDAVIDREQQGQAAPDDERKRVRDKMVDVINRRSYIRNLVRDVNTALED